MFVFDPLTQGLQLLAQRELQRAEFLFLSVINDPYAEGEDSTLARKYLNDIRSCQNGAKSLDFPKYNALAKRKFRSLENVNKLFADLYFSSCQTYQEFDKLIPKKIPEVIGLLKQFKIRDVIARDELFQSLEKKGIRHVRQELKKNKTRTGTKQARDFDLFRWKTIFRKFVELINPILLERHLELLEYILETGEISLLDDPKLKTLTPKHCWIIESTIKSKWFLLRSYFFKARSEIEEQFNKKEGTRKYWEEVKFKKIKIFENCGFSEQNIQKFLYSDKLNYKTLEEIYEYAKGLGLPLVPRDVSLALRGISKGKDHIKERAGGLIGGRKEFQDRLLDLGFSMENSYQIARHAKRANNHQISDSFKLSLKVASQEIYWYRVLPQSAKLRQDIEAQCLKHLSTVQIHLFERGRLNKLLLQAGKSLIRRYLIKTYGEDVVSLHCYFRLETIHQYYKLKFFEYHADRAPSVSELIKISREDFQPIILDGYKAFLKSKRLTVRSEIFQKMARHKSVTTWEDPYTTTQEKILLRFWFLMDHGVSISQGLLKKGVLDPSLDLSEFVKVQDFEECNS
ncbi:MAG: hypothetical protein VYC17_04095 [Nitrospinota bacterium]|nr:hypothetical protein [Nitrospinota bacterium]